MKGFVGLLAPTLAGRATNSYPHACAYFGRSGGPFAGVLPVSLEVPSSFHLFAEGAGRLDLTPAIPWSVIVGALFWRARMHIIKSLSLHWRKPYCGMQRWPPGKGCRKKSGPCLVRRSVLRYNLRCRKKQLVRRASARTRTRSVQLLSTWRNQEPCVGLLACRCGQSGFRRSSACLWHGCEEGSVRWINDGR